MHKGCLCFLELPKKWRGNRLGEKSQKETPAVWDHVLFGLGGSGTGRNAESPSEQQREISSSGGCLLKEWVIIVGQLNPFK